MDGGFEPFTGFPEPARVEQAHRVLDLAKIAGMHQDGVAAVADACILGAHPLGRLQFRDTGLEVAFGDLTAVLDPGDVQRYRIGQLLGLPYRVLQAFQAGF